jgi:GNAT superfamily N-acetyltransferase
MRETGGSWQEAAPVDGYWITDETDRLDLVDIAARLTRDTYWLEGGDPEAVKTAFRNSMTFGLFDSQNRQVGFARVVTDRALFAYLTDVFVIPEERGRGLGRRLVAAILAHPELRQVRSWMLASADARDWYRQFGFEPLAHPEKYMRRSGPGPSG